MAPILDLIGVYCPVGCGQTLHRMPGGLICCLAPKCPDKGAAQKILGDQETEHIVQFGEDGYTVRHPLRERLGDALMTCALHEYISGLAGPPEVPGRYRAVPDGDQWMWRPVT